MFFFINLEDFSLIYLYNFPLLFLLNFVLLLFIFCYYLYLFISLLFSCLNTYVCTCVCTCVCVCAMANKWISESNLQELVLLCAFWILKSGLQAPYQVLLSSTPSPLSFLNHDCVQTEFPALVVCFYLSICFECACVCGIHVWSPKIDARFFFSGWLSILFVEAKTLDELEAH